MRGAQRRLAVAVAALTTAVLDAVALADGLSQREASDVTVHIDNDLFSGAHRDQDYSWGIAVSKNGTPNIAAIRAALQLQGQLDVLVSAIEAVPGPSDTAWQFGVLAFTPGTLRRSEPVVGDRPYASLVHLTALRSRRSIDGDRTAYSALRIGWLGGRLAPDLHKAAHEWVGDEAPMGWDTQISDGGEPTVSYWRADDVRVLSNAMAVGRIDGHLARVWGIGTQTYAGVAVHARWSNGSATSDCFLPLSPGEYMTLGTSCQRSLERNGWSVHLGGMLRHVFYNAFLQGQFRSSEYVVSSRHMRRDVGSFWLALERQYPDYSWVYSLRYSTPELGSGVGARDMIWASLQLSR